MFFYLCCISFPQFECSVFKLACEPVEGQQIIMASDNELGVSFRFSNAPKLAVVVSFMACNDSADSTDIFDRLNILLKDLKKGCVDVYSIIL